jgi:hypothetical protein
MVQAGNTVELKLVIDRAELERQLSTGFNAAVGRGPKQRPSLLSPEQQAQYKGLKEQKRMEKEKADYEKLAGIKKPMKVNPGSMFMKIFKPLAALELIKFGINTMVKNSKILATTASAFGKILGAMLDLILLPFMPFLFKIFDVLIGWLPKIAEWSQKIAESVGEKIEQLKGWWERNWPTFVAIFKPITDTLVDLYTAIDAVLRLIPGVGGVGGLAKGTADSMVQPFKDINGGIEAIGEIIKAREDSKKRAEEENAGVGDKIVDLLWKNLKMIPGMQTINLDVKVDKDGNVDASSNGGLAKTIKSIPSGAGP